MARTTAEMHAIMESARGEFGEFGKVREKLSERPDQHAFMLLDKVVQAGGGGEFWGSVDAARVAELATDGDLVDLVRCGVAYDPASRTFSLPA